MLALLLLPGAAPAEAPRDPPPPAPQVSQPLPTAAPDVRHEDGEEGLRRDAGEYARLHGVSVDEALRRLKAQEDSVAVTDMLAAAYASRLAGVFIEHRPAWRITLSLAGLEPVPDTRIYAGGMNVTVHFAVGAAATRAQILAAIDAHQEALAALLPGGSGMGVDPRAGALALLVSPAQMREGIAADLVAAAEAIAGVPVLLRAGDGTAENLADPDAEPGVIGGARVVGGDPASGGRFVCTSGFVVTDGSTRGVVTAAHCPDRLDYRVPGGGTLPLAFAGQWGARFQDVQIGLSDRATAPLFFADSDKRLVRAVRGERMRTSVRVGDFVCHRGERSGYSCADVLLADYAPPPPLCAGLCDPRWVAVAGPSCGRGDSGGPVFVGGVAFGIVKAASYDRAGACSFYSYMPLDALPDGWRLLLAP